MTLSRRAVLRTMLGSLAIAPFAQAIRAAAVESTVIPVMIPFVVNGVNVSDEPKRIVSDWSESLSIRTFTQHIASAWSSSVKATTHKRSQGQARGRKK